MILTADQIRAARALKNWSQAELAKMVDMATPSIGNIESGKHSPSQATQTAIRNIFEEEGVEFIDGGVRLIKDTIRVIEGPDSYLRMLDDVYHVLRGKKNAEFLVSCSDDKVSPPAVNNAYRRMRSEGIRMRQLVEEGNTYLMGPLDEYRILPKERFINRVMVIYGDKVALVLEKETKIIVFKDLIMADVQRNMFELVWQSLPKPDKSTANERF